MTEKPLGLMDPLPKKLIMALGKLTARYGQLEHIIGVAMKRHDRSRTWEQIFEQLHKLGREAGAAQALMNYGVTVMDQQREGELLGLFKRASKLARDRHRVVHAYWSVLGDAHELLANHHGDPIQDTPESIEKFSQDLFVVVVEINSLTSEPSAASGGRPLTVEASANSAITITEVFLKKR